MFEKVNPSHPDKVADRIAGAIVDYCYSKQENPKVAVEVLLGHNNCMIINETSVKVDKQIVERIVNRIVGTKVENINYIEVPQDIHLADNQSVCIRCGDNGIFKGVPLTEEQRKLSSIARYIYSEYPCDGKYVLDGDKLIICQSNAKKEDLQKTFPSAIINPLGYWTGGIDVDSGATNRKLGSDMADSVTGGGLCLSGDSEFLSDDYKWHRMDEYKEGMKVGQYNNGNLEFVIPNKYISNKSDNFISFENNSKLSMCLTPYHEVLIKTSKGNLIKHKAEEVADSLLSGHGNLGSIIHNFTYSTSGKSTIYPDENSYRLQVAFCADGTIIKNRNWSGRIRVKKEYKKERMRKLLVGKDYNESVDGEYSIFWFNPTVVSKSLYECFKNEDFRILQDEIFKWDGDENLNVFRTTHKEDADFIQFVLACSGVCVGINISDRIGETFKGKYKRKSILYIVKEYKSTTTCLRENKGSKIDVKYIEEKMPSYCFNVPSHNLIIRHHNKIFITGNCGKDCSKSDVSINIYCWLMAQKTGNEYKLSCAIGDEYVDGKPYAEIVNIAKDYIKSVGGFEKFSEWGLV